MFNKEFFIKILKDKGMPVKFTDSSSIPALSVDEKIDRFKSRLEKRGVIATDAMINAVKRNNGNFTVYWKNNTGFSSCYRRGDGLECYPTEYLIERSDTESFTPKQWRFTGKMDCEQGVPACSDNEYYLGGYNKIIKTEEIL